MIEVATNCNTANTKKVAEHDKNSIVKLFCAVLEVKDQATLIKLGAGEMSKALKPDSLLERFAARKDANFKGEKEFLSLAGTAGQIENVVGKVEQENEKIAFKCLHYSVTESSGYVEVTVVNKKVESDITFGLRTVDITAKSPTEYTAIDEIFTIKKREPEKTIPISIIDNSDWQPDLEFKVELYDPETKEPLFGGDT